MVCLRPVENQLDALGTKRPMRANSALPERDQVVQVTFWLKDSKMVCHSKKNFLS